MTGAIPIRQGHVLITGGSGFLGTNIADRLAARGEEVVVFDNLSRPRVRENLAWLSAKHPGKINAAVADVRDPEALAEAVRGARAVIHLAAQVAVTTSVLDPVEDFEINARGTLNVLEAVRRVAPAAPVLFASTNKVYGKLLADSEFCRAGTRYAPRDRSIAAGFAEDTPLSLYSPYGCSKGAADQYVLDYARIFGLKTAVLRMSCLYGPHQYGSEDQGWVAHFLIRAHKGEPIAIYGTAIKSATCCMSTTPCGLICSAWTGSKPFGPGIQSRRRSAQYPQPQRTAGPHRGDGRRKAARHSPWLAARRPALVRLQHRCLHRRHGLAGRSRRG